jgi:hypothetical protein
LPPQSLAICAAKYYFPTPITTFRGTSGCFAPFATTLQTSLRAEGREKAKKARYGIIACPTPRTPTHPSAHCTRQAYALPATPMERTGEVTSQSISNQTQARLFRSTPQRSEILSTIGKPHPPFRPGRGRGSESTLKPEPGSHTLPRTEPAVTATESEIWSSGEIPAWRMLLVTSSLTTSRTSSSFPGDNRSLNPSRAWRAVVTTSGSGANIRFTSASIARLTPKSCGIGYEIPSTRIYGPLHTSYSVRGKYAQHPDYADSFPLSFENIGCSSSCSNGENKCITLD